MVSVRRLSGRIRETYLVEFDNPLTGKRGCRLVKGSKSDAQIVVLEIKKYYGLLESGFSSTILLEDYVVVFNSISNITKSKSTANAEMRTISDFQAYRQYGKQLLNSIGVMEVNNYIDYRLKLKKRNGKRLTMNTILQDIRNLKAFFKYAVDNMYIELSPMNNIRNHSK